jgi:hypothetical protein
MSGVGCCTVPRRTIPLPTPRRLRPLSWSGSFLRASSIPPETPPQSWNLTVRGRDY